MYSSILALFFLLRIVKRSQSFASKLNHFDKLICYLSKKVIKEMLCSNHNLLYLVTLNCGRRLLYDAIIQLFVKAHSNMPDLKGTT